MSEAVLTLDTPLDREATEILTDVNKVQISDPIEINFATRTLTFVYTKGYQSGSVITVTETSGVQTAQGADFDAIVQAAVTDTDTLGENLTAVLLQYLIDKDEVGPGTITP